MQPERFSATCPTCGIQFTRLVSQGHRVHCSRACRNTKIECTCVTCGKKFMRIPSAVRPTMYCSVACMQKRTEVTCLRCGKVFVAPVCTNRKYCSHSCNSLVQNPKGPANRAYSRVTSTCVICGTVFERSRGETRNKGGKYCSKPCSDVAKKALTKDHRYNYKGGPYPMACEVCGTIKMVRHSMVKRFRACSRRCACVLGHRAHPRTSSLEIAMLHAFAAADVVVVPQFAVDVYTADFAIPEHMLIIECDGIYWHNLPEQVKRDRNKDARLRRRGWTIIRLSEPDIRASPEACVDQVKQFLTH
jgi:very-short-patch-repair endonuclease/endogenous inhibitor of DNA gyrase (YacG/DUF329 family)